MNQMFQAQQKKTAYFHKHSSIICISVCSTLLYVGYEQVDKLVENIKNWHISHTTMLICTEIGVTLCKHFARSTI